MDDAIIAEPRARTVSARHADDIAALYRLTERLYRAETVGQVYEAALDAIQDVLGCERASVLAFDDEGVMRFVAARGLSDTYRRAVEGHSPWNIDDRDPEPIFVSDIELTQEPQAIKDAVRKENIRALAFIPLVAGERLIGKFMTYHDSVHEADEREMTLALTIARQLGFGLARDRAERARCQAEAELRQSQETFRLMSEHAPVMIWLSDAMGRCQHLNHALRTFWGVGDERLDEFNWQVTMHPEDAPEIGRQIMDAMAARKPVTIKGRYLDAAGRYRVLQTNARPRFSASGEFLGMIGVNIDITEREESEKALRDSEERFRLVVEAAPNGMVITDADGWIVTVNARIQEMLGYDRDALVGKTIESLIPDCFGESGRRGAESGSAARELVGRHRDGTEVPVEIRLSPIETSTGCLVIATVVDIGWRKRAEEQRNLLLAELNHRVKNTLAVVQGVAHQTFKQAETLPAASKAFEGRLIALAAAHNLLTQANWANAALGQLAADALQMRGPNKDRISLKGPLVLLTPRIAVALAMALHELFTNAVKYGALAADGGRVALDWSCTGGARPMLSIAWRETGGPPVSAPARQGFGTLLLERTLAQDLDGEVALEFKPDGLRCTIVAPLGQAGAA